MKWCPRFFLVSLICLWSAVCGVAYAATFERASYELAGNTDYEQARHIYTNYGILLEDEAGFLTTYAKEYSIDYLYYTLELFSGDYLKGLSSAYRSIGKVLTICVLAAERQSGSTTAMLGQFDVDAAAIYLYFYDNGETGVHGVRPGVIGHELGHVTYYAFIEVFNSIHGAFVEYNDGYAYAGDDWLSAWDTGLHSGTFAEPYSMKNYGEDIATIFESLVCGAGSLWDDEAPLYYKAVLLRDTLNECLPDSRAGIFQRFES